MVLEVDGVTRHVQFKSSAVGARASTQKVHIGLASKPSACVIWTRFDSNTMALGPFYFFGGGPGEPLPSLKSFPTAKHTKANADGVKLERPNLRVVGISRFRKLDDIPSLYAELFVRGRILAVENEGNGQIAQSNFAELNAAPG